MTGCLRQQTNLPKALMLAVSVMTGERYKMRKKATSAQALKRLTPLNRV